MNRVQAGKRHVTRVVAAAGLFAFCLSGGCGKKGKTYGDQMVDAYERGKTQQIRGDLESLSVAITSYTSSSGNLPEAHDIEELCGKLEPAVTRRCPRHDPWGHPYIFRLDGNSWSVTSVGRDGVEGNADDMVVSDGQFIKVPPNWSGTPPQ